MRNVEAHIVPVFTVYALTMLISRQFIGRMADKYGTVPVAIPSMVCFAVSSTALGVSVCFRGYIKRIETYDQGL
ncbi:drug resistance transporter, EmrB/QacA family [Clostridium sp. D5]|nr:drug resistance transporter, EmrB/QacA family [Clostridium sp. D5]